MFDNKRIFISGSTGSWGYALIKKLLANWQPQQIICFSRNELQQVQQQRHFDSNILKFVLGDVRDLASVKKATQGIDIIFHLAALKHVPLGEQNPIEFVKTNVMGTENMVECAIENHVERFINVSSDKACEPANIYGMTKAIGEKIISEASQRTSPTKFICIRGGNVMGSSGSVIPLFIQQIQNGGPIKITDPRMTRFFMSLSSAIDLLLKASCQGQQGEIFVLNMPSFHINDLASVLMTRYGTVQQQIIGQRPGEKLHEVLISHNETLNCFAIDDMFVILPPNCPPSVQQYYQNYPRFSQYQFTSEDNCQSLDTLSQLLEAEKWI